jgi:hypothetical protein
MKTIVTLLFRKQEVGTKKIEFMETSVLVCFSERGSRNEVAGS